MTTLLENVREKVSAPLSTRILAARIANSGVVRVSALELVEICQLFTRSAETNSQIVTRTTPRWKGGAKNPVVAILADPKTVVKVSRYNCNLGIWSAHVNRQTTREGLDVPPYEPLPPNGKEYMGDSPVMVGTNTGEFYLSVIPIGWWSETAYFTDTNLSLPNLHSEEYKWEGVGRAARETGIEKVPSIRTPNFANIVQLAPWGRGSDGRFVPCEMVFVVGANKILEKHGNR